VAVLIFAVLLAFGGKASSMGAGTGCYCYFYCCFGRIWVLVDFDVKGGWIFRGNWLDTIFFCDET